MIDSTALKTELQTDPKGVGYAAPIAAGSDQAVADLVNASTGNGADTLTLTTLDKNLFLTCTASAVVRLALGVGTDNNPINATIVTTWQAAMLQARAADPGSQIDLGVIAELAAIVGDPVSTKVMTQTEYTALTTRTCSRAEKLFGAGVVVMQSDVSFALRGNR